MYIVLTTCADSGDEGSYDGNVIGTFVELVNVELTEDEVRKHAEMKGSNNPDGVIPKVTIQKHPYDGSYEYMATLTYYEDEDERYGYDVFYHYKIPHL